MFNEILQSEKKKISLILSALSAFIIIAALFLLVRGVTHIGKANHGPMDGQRTVYVSGHGEAFAIPDVATISFQVDNLAASVPEAQTAVTTKMNDILAYLKTQDIAEKDIKTTNYNIYPEYEYQGVSCLNGYCPSGKQVLKGYRVSNSITVTIRKTETAGTILSGLGQKKVSNVSGISFIVENPEKAKAEARAKAIADAKAKAKVLAESLGVDLDEIINFTENSYPAYDMYARGGVMMESISAAPKAPTPEIPAGESKITSDITIGYQID